MHCPSCQINYNRGEPLCLNCHGALKSGRACPDCGAVSGEAAFVCGLCGKPLRANLKKVARERVESMVHATKVCPSCEEQYDGKAIFCRRCGTPLEMKDKRRSRRETLVERILGRILRPAA